MKLGIAPSEFWKMRPRHFWYLLEAAEPAKPKGLTDEQRAEHLEWLNGGP
jgi:hypothetical protein